VRKERFAGNFLSQLREPLDELREPCCPIFQVFDVNEFIGGVRLID
jgi:hypothetical protein